MEQRQIAQLMTIIANSYQSQLSKLDGKAYYDNLSMFLIDQDYTLVANNLKNHVLNSNYMPTIADLVKKPAKTEASVVPGIEETQAYIDGIKQLETQGIGRERAQVYIDRIKTMLGEME